MCKRYSPRLWFSHLRGQPLLCLIQYFTRHHWHIHRLPQPDIHSSQSVGALGAKAAGPVQRSTLGPRKPDFLWVL